jgi:primary-amine oxidase
MDRILLRALLALFLYEGCCISGAEAQEPLTHPLDSLRTAEYWTAYEVLQQEGRLDSDCLFASVLLHEPAKDVVLAWKEGSLIPREADVVILQNGKTFEAHIDLAGRKLLSWREAKDGQAPFLSSEIFGSDELIKHDVRVRDALKKRGITDLNTVQCIALPMSYLAVPEQSTQRIGFGTCSEQHGLYHTWGRDVEGLTIEIDMVARKVLKVVDTDVVPVSKGARSYEEIPESPRPGTTPLLISQPMGPSFHIKDGEISWQNWRFRLRIDPRVGPVLNVVQFADGGRLRSVMYQGSLSELFVPYMDPSNGWSNRVFVDAGGFYSSVGLLQSLHPGLDCPATAAYFDGISVGEHGAPKLTAGVVCLFERPTSDPAWRHSEGNNVYGRPSRELVLRSAIVVGNYDYLLDWRFEQDGRIEIAAGATGVIETKTASQRGPDGHMDMPEYGQFVAENLIGVNHDHFFSFRLDLDVDGPSNSFMVARMVQEKLPSNPMRKSIWAAKATIATREQDAIMDIRLDAPSMWLFINPNVKGALGYPTGYEIMPAATAKSLLTSDDPPQKLGAFSEHQFWVTPNSASERYAAGVYPTSSKGDDGLAIWTKANRNIENTDLVGWYTLGFHHMPRIEDWPVMPTVWHHFEIRPFNFFTANPVLDLPKAQ